MLHSLEGGVHQRAALDGGNTVMQLMRLIIFAAQTNLCSERIFPMILASTDCLFSERIFPMILVLTDQPTLFLGLEMTRTQLICDPRLIPNKLGCIIHHIP